MHETSNLVLCYVIMINSIVIMINVVCLLIMI